MSQTPVRVAESREFPRIRLPAMYTLIRVRPAGGERYNWTGYVYDVSRSGLRFELDHALDPGTRIDIRAMLPGTPHITISATGRVIRLHDDEQEPGPIRMGMCFETFAHDLDRQRLEAYLAQRLLLHLRSAA